MRPYEAATLILLFVTLCARMVPVNKRPRWLLLLPALTVLAAILQFIIEYYRWQMVPAYVLTAGLFLLALPLLWHTSTAHCVRIGLGRRIIRVTGIVTGFLMWGIALALPLLFPMFHLPTPTGPYAIVTISFEWVDDSRPETFTSDTDDHRDFLIQVWYPAENVAGAKHMNLWPEAKTQGALLSKTLGLPHFLFDHLSIIKTHSYGDVPVSRAEKTYPVLIFSHGYGLGIVNQNTA
jgi:hypothetical protein